MIRKLKLKNFRQHTDRTFSFTEGLNALRGANEAGKSTVIEAVLYALYGAKALRDSLSEAVTWGHKENELKVELVIVVDGVEYTYTRSKAGAECKWVKGEGYLVTGQAEVTALSAQLLGADAKTAASLMLADQSGLRGALDDGPTAVSGLMGKLADFNLIDRIIEEMQAKLQLGADGPIREKLKNVEKQKEEAIAGMPDEKELKQLGIRVANLDHDVSRLKQQRELVEARVYNDAVVALTDAEAKAKAREEAVAALDRAQTRLGKVISDLDAARAAVVVVDESHIGTLRAEIFDINETIRRYQAHALYAALPAYPSPSWEGDRASFDAEVDKQYQLLTDLRQQVETLDSEILQAERELVVGGVCAFCGTDISQREDIKQKNAETEARIADLKAHREVALAHRNSTLATVSALKEVANIDIKWRALVTPALAPYVTLDDVSVPPGIMWAGTFPSSKEVPSADALKVELAKLEKEAEASKKAEGAVEALTRTLEQVKQDHDVAAERLKVTPAINLEPFEAAHRAAADALEKVDNAIDAAEVLAKNETDAFVAKQRQKSTCQAAVNLADERIAEYTADLEAVGFNNSLLKKMRAIKPSVTDHLWNTVLAAVSQFFTQMRGEASVVTKDSDGFKVNAASVKSLSGSTLDVLALAVRVALTKTFVPHTSLLVLDEPAYGCDSTRTASLLGFLSSVGFQQVILASHDELSEAVSDNVISLGD